MQGCEYTLRVRSPWKHVVHDLDHLCLDAGAQKPWSGGGHGLGGAVLRRHDDSAEGFAMTPPPDVGEHIAVAGGFGHGLHGHPVRWIKKFDLMIGTDIM